MEEFAAQSMAPDLPAVGMPRQHQSAFWQLCQKVSGNRLMSHQQRKHIFLEIVQQLFHISGQIVIVSHQLDLILLQEQALVFQYLKPTGFHEFLIDAHSATAPVMIAPNCILATGSFYTAQLYAQHFQIQLLSIPGVVIQKIPAENHHIRFQFVDFIDQLHRI